ncbi:DUF551 domain-containing protein [Escherichia coli]|uniref:DUF551 domain-containing protein n=1 Tax=Escherichia coli TaxID=562 RepID=UPI000CFE0A50|nr:DUF551 domain-containing protein [Escherichia coli]
MNTLTKEWLQNTITSIESARDEIPFGLNEDQNNMLTALKIALTSLEAKPVASCIIEDGGMCVDGFGEYVGHSLPDGTHQLYAVPPVPDKLPREYRNGWPLAYSDYAEGWNDCRAAMLQSQGNCIKDGWISCSEQMPVIGELNWRTSFPLLITCEIGVIPAYYGFVSVNGDRHYGFMESLKYGDDSGGHPQTNEYGLISNVTHWMPLPEPPQEVCQ